MKRVPFFCQIPVKTLAAIKRQAKAAGVPQWKALAYLVANHRLVFRKPIKTYPTNWNKLFGGFEADAGAKVTIFKPEKLSRSKLKRMGVPRDLSCPVASIRLRKNGKYRRGVGA